MLRTRTSETTFSKEQKIYLKTICFFIFQDKNNISERSSHIIVKIISNMKTENENDLFEIEFYDGGIKKSFPFPDLKK